MRLVEQANDVLIGRSNALSTLLSPRLARQQDDRSHRIRHGAVMVDGEPRGNLALRVYDHPNRVSQLSQGSARGTMVGEWSGNGLLSG